MDLLAITTVAGNQTLDKTTLNAQRVCTVAGIGEVPIAAGCPAPLLAELRTATVHGETGLDGPDWPEPTVQVSDEHAVDLIIRTVRERPGEVSIVATGPLTNIAMAARREPGVVADAAEIVLMGGSYTRGNVTAAAEFNIYVDPEAAAIVFGLPWRRTMVGLDLTHQALATEEVFDRIEALATPLSEAVIAMLAFFRDRYMAEAGFGAPPVHDPCAVAALAFPELVTIRAAHVAIETAGTYTRGMTVTEFDAGAGHTLDTRVAVELDVTGFWDRMVAAIEHLGGVGRLS